LDGLSVPAVSAASKTQDLLSPQDVPNFVAYGAIELFRQGARRVQPDFELGSDNLNDVITICRLVEGMPLGVELAAAWVELLSPAEIAGEIRRSLDFLETNLHDIPDRQRSLRLVFESTWNRLGLTEREMFQQLSIFQGGFTREAAQQVIGASLRTLMALVNKSLLRPDFKGRYQLHELLRQFGAERLAQDPATEEALRDRHCTYFSTFLQQKEPDLIGQNQGKALADIEIDLDNVRAAWHWAVAHDKLAEIAPQNAD
jgi:predicted ATPase